MRQISGPDTQPWPSLRQAWYVVAVLEIAALLSYIDRFILGVLIEPIRGELAITDTQISLIAGGAFAIFFGFMALPLGRLADRTNRTRLIAFGVAGWSVMTLLSGLSRSYWELLLYRAGVGVGEASLSSSAYSLLCDYFPPHRLPLAISTYFVAATLGAAIGLTAGGWLSQWATSAGPVWLPLLGTLTPWRLCMVAVGLPGLLVALLVLTIREPARRGRLTPGADAPKSLPLRDIGRFVRDRRGFFVTHHVGFSLLAIYAYGLFIWGPTLLSRSYGLSTGRAGIVFGLAALVGGLVGAYASGGWAQILMRRGQHDAPMRLAAWATALLAPLAVIAPLAGDAMSATVLLGAALLLIAAASAVAPLILQLVAPNELRGQLLALFAFVSVVAGLGGGPTLVALLTEHVFGYPQALRYALAIVGGGAASLATALLFLGRAPFRAARFVPA